MTIVSTSYLTIFYVSSIHACPVLLPAMQPDRQTRVPPRWLLGGLLRNWAMACNRPVSVKWSASPVSFGSPPWPVFRGRPLRRAVVDVLVRWMGLFLFWRHGSYLRRTEYRVHKYTLYGVKWSGWSWQSTVCYSMFKGYERVYSNGTDRLILNIAVLRINIGTFLTRWVYPSQIFDWIWPYWMVCDITFPRL